MQVRIYLQFLIKIGSLLNRFILFETKVQDIRVNPLASNLFVSKKEIWKEIRAIQQPAFNPQVCIVYLFSKDTDRIPYLKHML